MEIPLARIAAQTPANEDWKSNYTVGVEPTTTVEGPEYSSGDDKFVVVEPLSVAKVYTAEVSIVGMTCSACVSCITRAVEELPWVRTINVSLLTNSAVVVFEGKHHTDDVIQTIEDAGFDATLESISEVKPKTTPQQSNLWKASYAIGGMTCSACSNSITSAVKYLDYVESVDINLISHNGTVVFKGRENVATITETIEDAGFEATLDNVVNVGAEEEVADQHRTVLIKINGMYCHHCPPRIVAALKEKFGKDIEFEEEPSTTNPIMKIKYLSKPPAFTIRHILSLIEGLDQSFVPVIHHPPTIEDKAREMHARERRRILLRLALSVTAGIPAFIIGIVCMNLLMDNNDIKMFMMHPMWAGVVSRAEWALFILATPVYLFAADTFHRKAFKEVKSLWRPGSPTPFFQRFLRFGSMNMLMSLGTSVAYFSSIAELIMASQKEPMMHMGMEEMMAVNQAFYFDSVIFLTMFLLIGRFLEAYSKAKTGDAVTQLGKLRPTEAILVEKEDVVGRKLPVDRLEIGDVVKVIHGGSPPFDGILIDSVAKFDESSLTGESKPVSKDIGDQVFSGTVNKGGPVSVRITSIEGSSMLDQIIKVVREGQTKRAPVERVADVITSHFVPFVVGVGIFTWLIWLILGETGVIPKDWRDSEDGGWPLWALRFAIAVFVVACPCGIGLAAPTALFVGGGMAAKHGILVKGGGDAFQEASTLDCIVFDKTGTLTSGGDPSVTDYRPISDDDEHEVLGMAKALEEGSGHPIAGAMVNFCVTRGANSLTALNTEEIPGKGMRGQFKLDPDTEYALDVDCIVGNERLMTEFDVDVDPSTWSRLQSWKRQGKSVVLLALRASNPFSDKMDIEKASTSEFWVLSAAFAVADALRPEAAPTVRALQKRGIAVWMLSGDNPTTAQAVAEMVGIPKEQVIAGVLPDQKAEKIQYLQRTLPKPRRRPRAAVAMVGDGINDSPALTMADVGIAIGSGSDVAISSADFILISSNLTSLLTLIDLSRVVFRRVWFNFGWALVYNCIAMPVAAGAFFPIVTSSGTHVRLDPVWAALAMALSSVSVVCSSLVLRSRLPLVGFRHKEFHIAEENGKADLEGPHPGKVPS
ncbi:heavy metal translocatin [Aulographum hederae CBS 113979]|uniref:Heavy metal translocatin n=1 Tax=Aulographum hederae CBS 113979 TaxID=1176131 RepID=A0A6G1GZJ6_9PEZI|nr:heavy metal translocatin [Aulographum hederae CBS 113979]